MRGAGAWRLAGPLLAAALAGGCAAPGQTRALLSSPPAGLARQVELTATPFFPQQRHQCGPAALATVMQAWRLPLAPDTLADEVYVPALHGSLRAGLAAAARRHGLLAYRLRPRMQDLLAEVAAGHPVVLFQNLATRWYPRWHFAVLVGYDLDTATAVLRSGRTRRHRTPLGTLERTWAAGGHWALVVVPAGRVPATARLRDYLQAAHALEAAGQADAAARAYRAATRRWPRRYESWFALANQAWAAGELAVAEPALREALRLQPADARIWNNLAYVLARRGCPRQALRAARCAVALAPGEGGYRDSLRELRSEPEGRPGGACEDISCPAVTSGTKRNGVGHPVGAQPSS